MEFTGAEAVTNYLPAVGQGAPLNQDLINPLTTSSGSLGGEVLALRLNLDFSDAGLLGPGLPGIQFSDLILTGFKGTSVAGLEGMTVKQFMVLDNSTLGGGSTGYSIDDLVSVFVGTE